jgi:hypothetical protein
MPTIRQHAANHAMLTFSDNNTYIRCVIAILAFIRRDRYNFKKICLVDTLGRFYSAAQFISQFVLVDDPFHPSNILFLDTSSRM